MGEMVVERINFLRCLDDKAFQAGIKGNYELLMAYTAQEAGEEELFLEHMNKVKDQIDFLVGAGQLSPASAEYLKGRIERILERGEITPSEVEMIEEELRKASQRAFLSCLGIEIE